MGVPREEGLAFVPRYLNVRNLLTAAYCWPLVD
jgi:hypothetical protein